MKTVLRLVWLAGLLSSPALADTAISYQNSDGVTSTSVSKANPLPTTITSGGEAVTPTNRSVSLTTGGTAQTVMSANTSRKGGYCQLDPSYSAVTIHYSWTTTAVDGTSTSNNGAIQAGGSFNFTSGQAGTIFTQALSAIATSGQNSIILTCVEAQ